jgi:probable rRNA maturation factor
MKNNKISLSVQYVSQADSLPTRAQWRRWIKAAFDSDVIMTLRIVDEEEGRELNKAYRGRDYATNVLTFVYDDAPLHNAGMWDSGSEGADGRQLSQTAGSASNVSQPPPLSGDVVICAPVVAREAAEQGKDLLAHYAHLAIHAALHLQGYDHEIDEEAEEMEALETALMLKLRYPDPYLET